MSPCSLLTTGRPMLSFLRCLTSTATGLPSGLIAVKSTFFRALSLGVFHDVPVVASDEQASAVHLELPGGHFIDPAKFQCREELLPLCPALLLAAPDVVVDEQVATAPTADRMRAQAPAAPS